MVSQHEYERVGGWSDVSDEAEDTSEGVPSSVHRKDKQKVRDHTPVEFLRSDSLEFVPLFPPGSPGCILEPHTVRNLVLLPCHVAP
jgi:hypothetical protein